MKNLTLQNIVHACGGIYHGAMEDLEKEVASITTDSRTAGENTLFAAIVGEKVDGHSFIPSVYAKGALCVISERELTEKERCISEEAKMRPDRKGNYILVESTLTALGAIAAFYLASLDIPVVGITGSVGKTSTKEMIAAVLSQKYHTLKTAGNFNNELGLPLTIFRLTEEHEIAVLEMGINHFGEMHRLAKIARPDTCVITNIGQCHLEFLGDRDGVLKAKSEIFDFIEEDGCIILNGEDDKLITLEQVKGIKPVFFGFGKENQVYADHIEKKGLAGISCCIHTPKGSFDALIPIPGIHMILNALAGTAVGIHYEMTLEEIKAGIESLQPVSGRFHIIHTNAFTIIDDCYNANPMSMKNSLSVLQDALGRKVAILGDMGELGSNEAELHREVGVYAGSLELDKCICIGPLCERLAEGIRSEGASMEVVCFENLQSFLKEMEGQLQKGDTVLVKASHFMHFEKIVERLTCI